MGTPRDAKAEGTAPARRHHVAARPLWQPHPDRLAPDDPNYERIVGAHRHALEAGADTYEDPGSGLTVLTAGYLARRGSCCDTGCRHCPYLA
jgi:Family of unknown function (DUF5522)